MPTKKKVKIKPVVVEEELPVIEDKEPISLERRPKMIHEGTIFEGVDVGEYDVDTPSVSYGDPIVVREFPLPGIDEE